VASRLPTLTITCTMENPGYTSTSQGIHLCARVSTATMSATDTTMNAMVLAFSKMRMASRGFPVMPPLSTRRCDRA